jgi:hypothetical protein
VFGLALFFDYSNRFHDAPNLGGGKEYRRRPVRYYPCPSRDGRNEFLFASYDSSKILTEEEKDNGYLRKKKTFFRE